MRVNPGIVEVYQNGRKGGENFWGEESAAATAKPALEADNAGEF
jgi:hypothetical protein